MLALHDPAGTADAAPLLDTAALGIDGPLTDHTTLLRLLARMRMRPLTDRRSPVA